MLEPLPINRWNFATAAHLLNRAGFGGTPAEIEAVASMSPAEAVRRLVHFQEIPDPTPKPAWAVLDPDRMDKLREMRDATDEERKAFQRQRMQEHRRQVVELQDWWLQRMVRTSRPLQEKLTLFWHGHFATSIQKVREPYLMWRQNELFRQHGAGSWLTLLDEVTRDPAMLIWLDQAQSRPGHPNENYARELLELFALGEGHYSESDVLEAARALTGLSLNRARLEPEYRRRLHDSGVKRILGKSGNFDGYDLVQIVAEHPQSARHLSGKLWRFFVSENPRPELIAALAEKFRAGDGHVGKLLETIFLSEEFHEPGNVRQQIKSPVQLLVMACRQLGRDLPPAFVSSNRLRLLGQELFAPPNVKGWDGGAAWINTNTLVSRHNLALYLVSGEQAFPGTPRGARPARQLAMNRMRGTRPDLRPLFEGIDTSNTPSVLAALERTLIQSEFRPKEVANLTDYLKSRPVLDDDAMRGLVRLAMCTPEYQLT